MEERERESNHREKQYKSAWRMMTQRWGRARSRQPISWQHELLVGLCHQGACVSLLDNKTRLQQAGSINSERRGGIGFLVSVQYPLALALLCAHTLNIN
jgi:hypothetical protein